MKIQKNQFLFSIIFYVILFVSCSNQSIFSDLDKPNTEIISNYTGKKLVTILEINKNSNSFYKLLTESQANKIISSLNDIISSNNSKLNENSVLKARAALCAVDILIYTDELSYAMIYDITNPILVAISGQGATASTIFYSYTEPFRNCMSNDMDCALTQIAKTFYNLFLITNYYDVAISTSHYANYSGADIQTYLISAIVSSVLSGTANAINVSTDKIQSLSDDIAQAYMDVVQATATELKSVLTKIFKQLKNELGGTVSDIGDFYKSELLQRAKILEELALYAGFKTVAGVASDVLKNWGENG